MEEIRTLRGCNFDQLAEAFGAAFKDYEISIGREELRRMLRRRGFDPALSFGAFENGRLVSFTFNGIGSFRGIKTAYDTGTGTIAEFRGRGLATEVFRFSLPFLRRAGIRQYLLEVLQHNDPAVKVYKRIGFEVTREFNYFSGPAAEVRPGSRDLPEGLVLKSMSPELRGVLEQLWDFVPSWQNSFEAISRSPEDFRMVGAYAGERLVGYGICEPQGGDITQLAVATAFRCRGIGSVLLKKLLSFNKSVNVKFVNGETGCKSLTSFLVNRGIPLRGRQFEMIFSL